MTFDEAAQRYAVLRQQRDTGQLPDAHFRQMVAQLTVTDANGAYWQLNADSGQWMVYNNGVWSVPASAAPQPLQPAQPAPQQYAQPYGYPPAQPAAQGQPETKTSWGQRIWDVFSVAGSAVMSAAWYWYSGMAETKADIKTCVAMVVIPVALIVFRKPLDSLLHPLEPFRSKVPPMVLAGCGVAIPFLVANYLYSSGESQFPYMFKTYVYSTLLTYILLRSPSGGRAMMPPGVSHQAGTI